MATVTNALGGTRQYRYDLLGRLKSETDEEGGTASYEYDALGRMLSATNPLGHTDYFTYDLVGRIKMVTDRNGNATGYNYDANGNIIETVDALGNTSSFEYDEMNRLKKVTLLKADPRRGVADMEQATHYQYDKRGLVKKEINALGLETCYDYDGNGNLVEKRDADGYITVYAYDPRNLVEAINYSDGRTVGFAYNANGELVEMADWNGTTSFALDLLGRIESVNDHNGKATGYEYDEVGNKTGMAYPDGSEVEYGYDLLGRLRRVTDAENQETIYGYDGTGRLTWHAAPNGWSVSYAYDAAGQLAYQYSEAPSGKPNDSIEHSYAYDAQGNVTAEYRSGAGGQDRFNLEHTYDALNRLTGTTGDRGYKERAYEYDSLGNLVCEQVHNKGTEYWYNELNQQVKKVVDGKDLYEYTFDNRGNLVQGVYHKNQNHSSIEEEYVYDAANRMALGTNALGETSEYVYNGLGHLVSNVWTVKKNAYGYTGVNAAPALFTFDDFIAEYEGDVIGYIDAILPGSGALAGEIDLEQPLVVVNEPGALPGGGSDVSFALPQAVVAALPNNQAAVVAKDYVIDYTSALGNVIMETETGAGSLTYRYVYGLEKLSVSVSPVTNGAGNLIQNGRVKLWYHHDRLGSTDFLTDNVSGKVTSYVTYDDWGDPTMKAVLKLGLRELDLVTEYTGHPWDPVLGAYYARARMYDAADRRFMAMDPVKGTIRESSSFIQYAYALNNPIVMFDPTGKIGIKMNYGSSGKSVKELQSFLKRYDYWPKGREDDEGFFGHSTTEALLRFQQYFMERSMDDLFPRGRYVGYDDDTMLAVRNILSYENNRTGDSTSIYNKVIQSSKYGNVASRSISNEIANPAMFFRILGCGVYYNRYQFHPVDMYENKTNNEKFMFLFNEARADKNYYGDSTTAEPLMRTIAFPVWRDVSGQRKSGTATTRINKKISDMTTAIFFEIFFDSEKFPIIGEIGGYVWRYGKDNGPKDSSRFSEHSHGIAVDINPVYNEYVGHPKARNRFAGTVYDKYTINKESSVYKIFKIKYGWYWGGEDFSRNTDPMHFQWALQ